MGKIKVVSSYLHGWVNYKILSPLTLPGHLLFIPGKFSPHGKQVIPRIYVDSEASTQNGRGKLGHPQEHNYPFSWARVINGESLNSDSVKWSSHFSCEVKNIVGLLLLFLSAHRYFSLFAPLESLHHVSMNEVRYISHQTYWNRELGGNC